jgi:hypothetical protein
MPAQPAELPYQHAITCGIPGVPFPDYENDGKSHEMCFGPDWVFADLVEEKETEAKRAGFVMGAIAGVTAGLVVGILVGGTL